MKKVVVILWLVVLGIVSLVMPGSAQTEVCHGDILSGECGCTACALTDLHLTVTPTCDGLDFSWNDIGAPLYLVVFYDSNTNQWNGICLLTSGTSCSVPNINLPQQATSSFAVLTYNPATHVYGCQSNIVCDVTLPATCPKVPGIQEFPSMFLPATMIIGFLGAVLLIQRTKEN